MLGAISGDIIGSVYEQDNIKTKKFPLFSPDCRFTDDTVLTCAIADSLIHGRHFAETIKRFYHFYPKAGYGYMFSRWANSDERRGYGSFGNGSAMRVSPIAWAYDTIEEVVDAAKASAEVTHSHSHGIRGAQAIAAAIFVARTGGDKSDIKEIAEDAGYSLDFSLDEIRPDYQFDASCQNSVPQAIKAFLESSDFEDAIRNAISIGGDSDTIACMAGSIAEAYYDGVPREIAEKSLGKLDSRLSGIYELFKTKFMSA